MEAKMKRIDEVAGTPESIGTRLPEDAPGALPPFPSEDQKFFDEALWEGVRSMGALVRSRKKPKS
jgi:hypothetical protein